MWKLETEAVEAVKFCESGSTFKKEAGSGSDKPYTELEAEAKIFYFFYIPGINAKF